MVVDYQALKAITTLVYDRSRATLGDNQESMKAPKGLPSGRLTTKSAKETSMVVRSRYGVTPGPPDSPARGQQCNNLVRANHYAFRCCPSYGNDQSKWRRWFCDLKGNKEILQAVRHQAQVEGVEVSISDVRPWTMHYLLHQCQPPADYDSNDKSWLLDATKRQEALNQRAKQTRNRPKFIAAQTTRKRTHWKKVRAS